MKNIFLFFLILTSAPYELLSQTNTVVGTVTDTKTNDPIYLANVYIVGKHVGTTTDQKGNYKLALPDSILKAENIFIASNYPGYFTDTFKIETKQASTSLNISLLEKHALILTDFTRYPIIGYTINSLTHQPVAGVKIKATGSKNTTTSRNDGTFTITFPNGTKQKKVTVCFSKKGFSKKSMKFDISHWTVETIVRLEEIHP